MKYGDFSISQVDDYRWHIPRQGKMRTDGVIYADKNMMQELIGGNAIEQVVNVAQLPGIVGPAMAMPDIHWGYGFPIGGVAAFDMDYGIISPGGVGYDINCGVRLLATPLSKDEVTPAISRLMDRLFGTIPTGVGASRSDIQLDGGEIVKVMRGGARWAVERGYGTEGDLRSIEANGRLAEADPSDVSARAKKRGRKQMGTLGSGNHFIEVGYVAQRYDDAAADALGLYPGAVTVFIHSGSRGLGHQVCDDYIDVMLDAARRYGIELPDDQLCCAPLSSPEAGSYRRAMSAAANYAFANRQVMSHYARLAVADVFGHAVSQDTRLIYDVAHNIAKFEEHTVGGSRKTLCVHRKGATRALPPRHPELDAQYHDLGQPVLIPGDMGRYSYVLLGTSTAYEETFGSTCHGAGRLLSRHKAKKAARSRNVPQEMSGRGIELRAASKATVDEEIPEAYKDVRNVVDVVDRAGIGRKVVQLRPLGVIKG
jgi:tRNA-splicing ligase RtcB